MNRFTFHKNKTINLIYFIFVFSLASLAGNIMQLELTLGTQLLIALAVTIYAKLIVRKISFLFLPFIILIIGLTIGRFVNVEFATYIQLCLERFVLLLENIYSNMFMGKVILKENILPYWILIISVYSIFTSFVIFKLKRSLWVLLPIYIPLLIYYWYLDINNAYFSLIMFLFYFLLLNGYSNFNREIHLSNETSKQDYFNIFPLWKKTNLIYSFLIIIIALLLPKSDNYLYWPWMESQINSIMPNIQIFHYGYKNVSGNQALNFNFANTGFQIDSSRLGGPISPDTSLIMNVKAGKPVYLRGTVRHIYDGNMWEISENSMVEYNSDELFKYKNTYEAEHYKTRNIRVQFENYSSKTLFSPLMTIAVNIEGKDQISLNKDHIMEVPEGIYTGETYTLTVLQIPTYYEALNMDINNSYEDLENIEDYLQVPIDRITQRTLDLKDSIIHGVEGNYEKAKAFESFFLNNYDYKLDTSIIPEGKEFIDYFLFEERAGYCTYYATAMAIFLRLEGIPSRYVEGYIAHGSRNGGSYEVKQSNAHAWVEAYIEPVGWITFEPTPAYRTDNVYANYNANDNEDDNADDNVDDNVDEEIWENELNNELDNEKPTTNSQESNDDSNTEDLTRENSNNRRFLVIVLLTLIAFICFAVIQYIKKILIMKSLPANKKVIILYEEILQLIGYLEYPKKPSETLHEYTDKLGHKFIQLREITDIYVRNKYGDKIPSNEEIQKFEEYHKVLKDQLGNSLDKFKYFIYKLSNKSN